MNFCYGNNKAFDELIDKYRNNVIYFINYFVKNIHTAEDLAQDVFVYILINKKEYDFKYSMKTYLYTIARSRALNYLKKEKRIIPLEESTEYYNYIEYTNEIEDKIYSDESKIKMHQSIKKLSIIHQNAIYLADIERLQYKDICKILGKTLPQTKMIIYRARKNLKSILEKDGYYNEQ